jgi:hypothetical protein
VGSILASLTAGLYFGFAGSGFANLDFPAVLNSVAHISTIEPLVFENSIVVAIKRVFKYLIDSLAYKRPTFLRFKEKEIVTPNVIVFSKPT